MWSPTEIMAAFCLPLLAQHDVHPALTIATTLDSNIFWNAHEIKAALKIAKSIWHKNVNRGLLGGCIMYLGKICLKNSQTFINCDFKNRLNTADGTQFLESLTDFFFYIVVKSMLGWVIWPEFWISQTNFLGKFQLKTAQTYWGRNY